MQQDGPVLLPRQVDQGEILQAGEFDRELGADSPSSIRRVSLWTAVSS